MSTEQEKPHENAIRIAIGHAMLSPCQSKRGAAIFEGRLVYASGHNEQVNPFECDGSDECKRTCRHSAIHAEQAALIRAGLFAQGRSMLHVKVVDGALVPSGPPSCPACSRLIVAAGIRSMWLFHESGWNKYTSAEFHRLSVSASAPPAGAQGETPKIDRFELDNDTAQNARGHFIGAGSHVCFSGDVDDLEAVVAQQAEEIARLRAEREGARESLSAECARTAGVLVKLDAALSQVQALQAHLSEAQQRIETLTAERDRLSRVINSHEVFVLAPQEDQP